MGSLMDLCFCSVKREPGLKQASSWPVGLGCAFRPLHEAWGFERFKPQWPSCSFCLVCSLFFYSEMRHWINYQGLPCSLTIIKREKHERVYLEWMIMIDEPINCLVLASLYCNNFTTVFFLRATGDQNVFQCALSFLSFYTSGPTFGRCSCVQHKNGCIFIFMPGQVESTVFGTTIHIIGRNSAQSCRTPDAPDNLATKRRLRSAWKQAHFHFCGGASLI